MTLLLRLKGSVMLYNMDIKHTKPNIRQLLKQGYTCVDMHTHTEYSKDAFGNIKKSLERAKKLGIGFAISDHNEIDAAIWAWQNKGDVLVIPGIEMKAFNGIDILVYFYDIKDLISYHEKYIKPRQKKDDFVPDITVEEIIKFARNFKCVIGAPHPYVPRLCGIGCVVDNGVVNENLMKEVDFVEVINSYIPLKNNIKAVPWANKYEKAFSAGSDAHLPSHLGRALTCIKLEDGEHFLDALKSKKDRLAIGKSGNLINVLLFVIGQFKLLAFKNGWHRFIHHLHTCISIKNRL